MQLILLFAVLEWKEYRDKRAIIKLRQGMLSLMFFVFQKHKAG